MLITKNLASLIFLFFCCYSCNNSATYLKNNSGIEYKFIIENEQKKLAKIGDVIIVDIKYYLEDSLIFDLKKVNKDKKIKIYRPSHEGGCLEDALTMLSVGDSAHFLISAESFYKHTRKQKLPSFISKNAKLRFEIKLLEIFSEIEALEDKAKHNYKLQKEEERILKEYLQIEDIKVKPTKSGLYVVNLKKGKGNKPKLNDIVKVHYKVYLINGKIVDSSIDRGEVFEFKVGDNDLFHLWDEVIQNMQIGDKVKVITGSENAYKKIGAGDLIPPFSSLIFEIKLIDIRK